MPVPVVRCVNSLSRLKHTTRGFTLRAIIMTHWQLRITSAGNSTCTNMVRFPRISAMSNHSSFNFNKARANIPVSQVVVKFLTEIMMY